MSFRLFDLNDAQRVAVTQTAGPVLILAGAGTGKTRVITARIAYLVAQGVSASKILAVTFTNKAATEMRERAVGLLQDDEAAKKLTVSTFHALCVRILRADIETARLEGEFFHLRPGRLPRVDPRDHHPHRRQGRTSRSERRAGTRLTAQERPAHRSGRSACERGHADRRGLPGRYQAELKRMNAVDFDDLLLLAVRVLREHAEARAKWRDRFHYLMVDEFQDTNRLQLDLVSLLAHGEPPNVCVVGDDDQSIYGWRGAEVANILEFERHFPASRRSSSWSKTTVPQTRSCTRRIR